MSTFVGLRRRANRPSAQQSAASTGAAQTDAPVPVVFRTHSDHLSKVLFLFNPRNFGLPSPGETAGDSGGARGADPLAGLVETILEVVPTAAASGAPAGSGGTAGAGAASGGGGGISDHRPLPSVTSFGSLTNSMSLDTAAPPPSGTTVAPGHHLPHTHHHHHPIHAGSSSSLSSGNPNAVSTGTSAAAVSPGLSSGAASNSSFGSALASNNNGISGGAAASNGTPGTTAAAAAAAAPVPPEVKELLHPSGCWICHAMAFNDKEAQHANGAVSVNSALMPVCPLVSELAKGRAMVRAVHRFDDARRRFGLSHVQLSIDRQFFSRSDMFLISEALLGRVLYVGEVLQLCGFRVQVNELLQHPPTPPSPGAPPQQQQQGAAGSGTPLPEPQRVTCGIVVPSTRTNFQTLSPVHYVFVELGREMWDPTVDGRIALTWAVQKFVRELVTEQLSRRKAAPLLRFVFTGRLRAPYTIGRRRDVLHLLNVPVDASPGDITDEVQAHCDSFTRRLLREVQVGALRSMLAREGVPLPPGLDTTTGGSKSDAGRELLARWTSGRRWRRGLCAARGGEELERRLWRQWRERWAALTEPDIFAPAKHSNTLETVSIVLERCGHHHIDRRLNVTGHKITVVSAGKGVYATTNSLVQITCTRLHDVGLERVSLVCVGRPPLHAVPLLEYDARDESLRSQYHLQGYLRHHPRVYERPEWIECFFYHPQLRYDSGESRFLLLRKEDWEHGDSPLAVTAAQAAGDASAAITAAHNGGAAPVDGTPSTVHAAHSLAPGVSTLGSDRTPGGGDNLASGGGETGNTINKNKTAGFCREGAVSESLLGMMNNACGEGMLTPGLQLCQLPLPPVLLPQTPGFPFAGDATQEDPFATHAVLRPYSYRDPHALMAAAARTTQDAAAALDRSMEPYGSPLTLLSCSGTDALWQAGGGGAASRPAHHSLLWEYDPEAAQAVPAVWIEAEWFVIHSAGGNHQQRRLHHHQHHHQPNQNTHEKDSRLHQSPTGEGGDGNSDGGSGDDDAEEDDEDVVCAPTSMRPEATSCGDNIIDSDLRHGNLVLELTICFAYCGRPSSSSPSVAAADAGASAGSSTAAAAAALTAPPASPPLRWSPDAVRPGRRWDDLLSCFSTRDYRPEHFSADPNASHTSAAAGAAQAAAATTAAGEAPLSSAEIFCTSYCGMTQDGLTLVIPTHPNNSVAYKVPQRMVFTPKACLFRGPAPNATAASPAGKGVAAPRPSPAQAAAHVGSTQKGAGDSFGGGPTGAGVSITTAAAVADSGLGSTPLYYYYEPPAGGGGGGGVRTGLETSATTQATLTTDNPTIAAVSSTTTTGGAVAAAAAAQPQPPPPPPPLTLPASATGSAVQAESDNGGGNTNDDAAHVAQLCVQTLVSRPCTVAHVQLRNSLLFSIRQMNPLATPASAAAADRQSLEYKSSETVYTSSVFQRRWQFQHPRLGGEAPHVASWSRLCVCRILPLYGTKVIYPTASFMRESPHQYTAGGGSADDLRLRLIEYVQQRLQQQFQIVVEGTGSHPSFPMVWPRGLPTGNARLELSLGHQLHCIELSETTRSVSVTRESHMGLYSHNRATRLQTYEYALWNYLSDTFSRRELQVEAQIDAHNDFRWEQLDRWLQDRPTIPIPRGPGINLRAREVAVVLLPRQPAAPVDFATFRDFISMRFSAMFTVRVPVCWARHPLPAALRVPDAFDREAPPLTLMHAVLEEDAEVAASERRHVIDVATGRTRSFGPLRVRDRVATIDIDLPEHYHPACCYYVRVTWLACSATAVADWYGSFTATAGRFGFKAVPVPCHYQNPKSEPLAVQFSVTARTAATQQPLRAAVLRRLIAPGGLYFPDSPNFDRNCRLVHHTGLCYVLLPLARSSYVAQWFQNSCVREGTATQVRLLADFRARIREAAAEVYGDVAGY